MPLTSKERIKAINAESFQKFLDEMTAKNPHIEDVFYDNHHGFWNVKTTDGETTEFETFLQMFEETLID